MSQRREIAIDNLLAEFQRVCEKCAMTPDWTPGSGVDWRLERAIIRNEIRARLLEAPR